MPKKSSKKSSKKPSQPTKSKPKQSKKSVKPKTKKTSKRQAPKKTKNKKHKTETKINPLSIFRRGPASGHNTNNKPIDCVHGYGAYLGSCDPGRPQYTGYHSGRRPSGSSSNQRTQEGFKKECRQIFSRVVNGPSQK